MTTALINRKSLLSDLDRLERIWNTWEDTCRQLPRTVNTDGSSATVKVEVPGIDPSEIRVRVKGNTVCIESPKGITNVPIGEGFDINQTSATLKYGLLTVNIPRKNEKVLDIIVET